MTNLSANDTESSTDYDIEDLPWLTAGSCEAGMQGKPPGRQREEADQKVDENPEQAVRPAGAKFPS